MDYLSGQSSLFGMDKSDALYQQDQRKAELELEKKQSKEEAQLLSQFRMSSARRNDSFALEAFVRSAKTDKRGLETTVKLVPQRKRSKKESPCVRDDDSDSLKGQIGLIDKRNNNEPDTNIKNIPNTKEDQAQAAFFNYQSSDDEN